MVSTKREISRRQFLKMAVPPLAIAYTAADAYLGLTPYGKAVRAIFTLGNSSGNGGNQTSTATTTPTTTPALSPLASYAKKMGLSQPVIDELSAKLGDKLTTNNQSLVDYLSLLSQTDVVSPDVLQLTSPDYKSSVVQSLQIKTIDDVIQESKVPDQTVVGLGYLSTFPGPTQRWYIEQHGLDESAIDLLTRAKSLGNQDFAKYAVGSLVCIQDHNPLTKEEVAFLQNPGNNFRAVRDEYLASMESRGNPYDSFARDWRKLLKNAKLDGEMESLDATEDWVNLVLNSDNSEVLKAEKLKLSGGTPDSRDFHYVVPDWNTAQQVQYWLGKQNEFKKNDTLTQSIAAVNGLWVTVGDNQVRNSVSKDTNDLLNFLRETSEMQKAKGYYMLENYPWISLTDLAWTGGIGQVHSPYRLIDNIKARVTLPAYQWNTVSVTTLKKMRELIFNNGWFNKDVGATIGSLENYYYFTNAKQNGSSEHWDYADPSISGTSQNVVIDGITTLNNHINNVDFEFSRILGQGKGIGNCGDETGVIDAFAKSVGIATRPIQKWRISPVQEAHMHCLFFDPNQKTYSAYSMQLNSVGLRQGQAPKFSIWSPPIKQAGYLASYKLEDNFVWINSNFQIPANMTPTQLYNQLMSSGVPTTSLELMDKQYS